MFRKDYSQHEIKMDNIYLGSFFVAFPSLCINMCTLFQRKKKIVFLISQQI